jgi:alkylation response protein AidB-like acyl-CoA dehydrogenase
MDLRPSPAQQLLVATAREYLRRHCPIELVQELAVDERGFPDKLWRGMAELGWPGLLVPGDLGGSDGTLLDVTLLVEELGHACVPGPFVASAVAATSVLLAAGAAHRKRVLPALAGGDRIATLALVEERGSFDADTLTLEVAGSRLTGRKLFVKDAHVADDLVVVLREGALLLPVDRAGIARWPLATLSDERVFEVVFDGVEVRDDDRLPVGRGAIAMALEAGALARTAEMVGAAQRILEMTVEHAKTRVQGGRPIGGHQAIQHACADLVRDVDCARGLLYATAWRLTGEGAYGFAWESASADVAMAKAYAGEACLNVARRAHQIFGAISYCAEHPLHLLHKRIQAASLDFGDAALHLERVASAIGLQR